MPSVVCRPPSSIIFSQITEPIEAKFHVESPWNRLTKTWLNGPGYISKMAATPIYGDNLKIFFFRTEKADYIETWFADVIFFPYTFVLVAFVMDFSETIEMYDIKVAIYSNKNEYMKTYLFTRGQVNSLTFDCGHSDVIKFTLAIETEPVWVKGTTFVLNGRNHMTKVAAMTVYGKKL